MKTVKIGLMGLLLECHEVKDRAGKICRIEHQGKPMLHPCLSATARLCETPVLLPMIVTKHSQGGYVIALPIHHLAAGSISPQTPITSYCIKDDAIGKLLATVYPCIEATMLHGPRKLQFDFVHLLFATETNKTAFDYSTIKHFRKLMFGSTSPVEGLSEALKKLGMPSRYSALNKMKQKLGYTNTSRQQSQTSKTLEKQHSVASVHIKEISETVETTPCETSEACPMDSTSDKHHCALGISKSPAPEAEQNHNANQASSQNRYSYLRPPRILNARAQGTGNDSGECYEFHFTSLLKEIGFYPDEVLKKRTAGTGTRNKATNAASEVQNSGAKKGRQSRKPNDQKESLSLFPGL